MTSSPLLVNSTCDPLPFCSLADDILPLASLNSTLKLGTQNADSIATNITFSSKMYAFLFEIESGFPVVKPESSVSITRKAPTPMETVARMEISATPYFSARGARALRTLRRR